MSSSTSISANSAGGTQLNVQSIVSQLMSVEQQPLNIMNSQIASYQAKISAYGTVQSALSTFQTAMAGLSNISTYQKVNATSSNTGAVSASATATATTGSYELNVTNLAQAQQLEAAGETSSTAAIGTGTPTTLTFDFGTIAGTQAGGTYPPGSTFASNGNGAKTVTIDSSNNSLQGIANAINNAGIGVSASIVNDGSAAPYRLVLTSNSGAANSMKISVSGSPADPTLSALLSQDPAGTQKLSEVTTAQNAAFTVNGVAISSSGNTDTGAINGVTLNLLNTGASNVSVTQDTSAIGASIQSFVTAYNNLHSTIQTNTAYNASTNTGSALTGDVTTLVLQSKIHSVLNTPVTGTSGSITAMANVGVTFQKDGTLAVNTTTLNSAISGNYSGVVALLSTVGTASDSLVSYNSSTGSTVPGSYAVNVSAVATQGSTVGNLALGSTVIAANTTINATVNGTSSPVALAAGNYTATQLATMIQSAINGTSAFAGSSVAAKIDGHGFLNLTSNLYGSPSNVRLDDGTVGAGMPPPTFSIATLMGTATDAPGTDVAGTIGGQAATGSGQYLTAAAGNATGLKIQVNGGATGARGTVNFSQGYASTLNQLTTSMLSTSGGLNAMTTGLNSDITYLNNQEAALNVRLTALQAAYTKQFTALDVSLSNMNSTSTYLTQQLANLSKA